MKQSNPLKFALLRITGLSVCIFPAFIAVLSYFPIWMARNDTSIVSGFTLLLLGVSLIPLWKYISIVMRSPSAPLMWLIMFVIFFTLSKIAEEMTVISFVGFVSNLIGAAIFRFADRYKQKKEE